MTDETPLRAELYLRSGAYGILDAQQRVSTRVRQLEANGMFSESIVAGRWQRLQAEAEDWRPDALDTYEEFRDWARRNGFSLEPAFQRRTRTFVGMDRVEEVVVFPVISLAVYDGRDLAAVFPCSDGETVYTVDDALDAFERGDAAWLTQFDSVTVERAGPRLDPGDVTAD